MLRYGITKLTLGDTRFVAISEENYRNIVAARECLFEALFMEEDFDVVVENYLEFEVELLSSATRHMILRNQDYSWFHNERVVIARRITNLLGACESYLDRRRHHLKGMYGDNKSKIDDVEAETNRQYDSRLGYRVMEAL